MTVLFIFIIFTVVVIFGLIKVIIGYNELITLRNRVEKGFTIISFPTPLAVPPPYNHVSHREGIFQAYHLF